jgi:hypothetical protein
MKYILFFICISFCKTSDAQSPEDSVKAAVNQLFLATKNADASLYSSSFTDSAILQTIKTNEEGKVSVENYSVTDVANVISKLQKNDVDERIQTDIVKIDGPLAIVWAPYKIYFKDKFSNCGVDSFQLVRVNGKWKIQYLIDTRRTKSCN